MLINTSRGEMDESLLEKAEGHLDNDVETTSWVEYRMRGDPPPRVRDGVCFDCLDGICKHIHRSVTMHLKTGVFAEGIANPFA